ncbi:hypothetical protein [Lentzea sp. NPDC055074]
MLPLASLPLSQALDQLVDGGPGWWLDQLMHLRLKTEVVHPLALSPHWLGALVTGLLTTVWWYRWCAAWSASRPRPPRQELTTATTSRPVVCIGAVTLCVPNTSSMQVKQHGNARG